MAQQTTLIPLAARTSTLIVDSDLDLGAFDISGVNANFEAADIAELDTEVIDFPTDTGIISTHKGPVILYPGGDNDIILRDDAEHEVRASASSWSVIATVPALPLDIDDTSKVVIATVLYPPGTTSHRYFDAALYRNGSQVGDVYRRLSSSGHMPVSWVTDIQNGDVFDIRGQSETNNQSVGVYQTRMLAVMPVFAQIPELVVPE